MDASIPIELDDRRGVRSGSMNQDPATTILRPPQNHQLIAAQNHQLMAVQNHQLIAAQNHQFIAAQNHQLFAAQLVPESAALGISVPTSAPVHVAITPAFSIPVPNHVATVPVPAPLITESLVPLPSTEGIFPNAVMVKNAAMLSDAEKAGKKRKRAPSTSKQSAAKAAREAGTHIKQMPWRKEEVC